MEGIREYVAQLNMVVPKFSGSQSAEAGIAVKHKANIDKRISILGNINNIKIMTNNMSITAKITRAIALLLAIFSMSACSTYPNKFKCGDARGLGCTMLSEVDKQIDSGKIEQKYTKKRSAEEGVVILYQIKMHWL